MISITMDGTALTNKETKFQMGFISTPTQAKPTPVKNFLDKAR
jgi:hypothetical protein